jgi:hypothetical protein
LDLRRRFHYKPQQVVGAQVPHAEKGSVTYAME